MKILIVGPVPQAILDRLGNLYQIDQTCDYFLVPIKLERDYELNPVVIIDMSPSETEKLIREIRNRFAGRSILVVTHNGLKEDLTPRAFEYCPIICTMDKLEARIYEYARDSAPALNDLRAIHRLTPSILRCRKSEQAGPIKPIVL